MPTLSTKRTMARANLPLAKRLKTVERAVKRNTTELKSFTASATSVGVPLNLAGFISPGTASNERVGDVINIKKVEVRFLGNAGLNRLRCVLYTPEDLSVDPPYLLGNNFFQFIEKDENKIWDEYMDDNRQTIVAATGAGNVPLPGKAVYLSKTFSIPMKVKYRQGQSNPFHNPVALMATAESPSATSIAPPNDYGDFIFKIWYYDA